MKARCIAVYTSDNEGCGVPGNATSLRKWNREAEGDPGTAFRRWQDEAEQLEIERLRRELAMKGSATYLSGRAYLPPHADIPITYLSGGDSA